MAYLVGAGTRDPSSSIDTSVEGFQFNSHRLLLMKLTSEYEDDVSGYHYEELMALSHNSPYFRQELVEYFIQKMKSRSWIVRHKAVKALHKLCRDGHHDVRGLLRMRDGDVRKTLDGCPPPSAMNGHADITMFTSAVQELLRFVFNPRHVEPTETARQGTKIPLTGIGSSQNTGKYEGFGNSPIQRQEGVLEKIIDVVDKVSRVSEEDPILKKILEEDMDNEGWIPLDPKEIGMQEALDSIEDMFKKLKTTKQPITSKPAALVPGRAGGGWESDSEDEDSKREGKESQARMEVITNYFVEMKTLFPTWPVDVVEFRAYAKKAVEFKQEELAIALVDQLETAEDATLLYIYLFFVDTCINMSVLSAPTCRELLEDTLYEIRGNPISEARTIAKCSKILKIIDGLFRMMERRKNEKGSKNS